MVKFNWPVSVTMLKVEEFRWRYILSYSLHECAMMLAAISRGSVNVTWFVAESIVESIKSRVDEKLFLEYDVITVEIAGDRVYHKVSQAAYLVLYTLMTTTVIHICVACFLIDAHLLNDVSPDSPTVQWVNVYITTLFPYVYDVHNTYIMIDIHVSICYSVAWCLSPVEQAYSNRGVVGGGG